MIFSPPFSYISYVVLQYSIARGRAVGREEGGREGGGNVFALLLPFIRGLHVRGADSRYFPPPPQPAANAAQLLPDPSRIFPPLHRRKKRHQIAFFLTPCLDLLVQVDSF